MGVEYRITARHVIRDKDELDRIVRELKALGLRVEVNRVLTY